MNPESRKSKQSGFRNHADCGLLRAVQSASFVKNSHAENEGRINLCYSSVSGGRNTIPWDEEEKGGVGVLLTSSLFTGGY